MLYIISTPIGNLKDITLRALEVLESVDIIACEDTRHSLKLLNHYGIKKPLISYHEHNERGRTEEIIRLLEEGKNVGLITDAGTPCISDPGSIVVQESRRRNLEISVIPGASALVAALSLAGIQGGFAFVGFLPDKNKSRQELLSKYENIDIPLVLYCSPHSINNDAKTLYDNLGNREVIVVKELTKMFESVTIIDLESFPLDNPRGEYVMIVQPSTATDPLNELSVKEHLIELINNGIDKKEAIKTVAKARGINKNIVYQESISLSDEN